MAALLRIFAVALGLGLLLSGCCTYWPTCKSDKDCRALSCRGKAGRSFLCIQKLCRECRSPKDCPTPRLYKCQGHRCVKKTCADVRCPTGKRCEAKSLRCRWPCEEDGESPCDGDPCKVCKGHQCIYRPPGCIHSEDCPHAQVCLHAERCDARCGVGCDEVKCPYPSACWKGKCQPPCALAAFYFQKGSVKIQKGKATQKAIQLARACLRTRPQKRLMLQGHGDEGETREYNIHRHLKRAWAVWRLLKERGIPEAKLCVSSLGKERQLAQKPHPKRSQAQNRRVSLRDTLYCP